jgi:hypothetical protein
METSLRKFATALALFAMATVGAILLTPPQEADAHTGVRYCGHTSYIWNNYSHPVKTVHNYAYNDRFGNHVHGTTSKHRASNGDWYTVARYEHYC